MRIPKICRLLMELLMPRIEQSAARPDLKGLAHNLRLPAEALELANLALAYGPHSFGQDVAAAHIPFSVSFPPERACAEVNTRF